MSAVRGLADFYADPRRWESSETDLGLQWVDAAGLTYRAAWIEATEELYCVQHLGTGGGGSVRILGRIPSRQLDAAVEGWQDVCGGPESFEWLCSRMPERSVRARRRRTAARRRGRWPSVPSRELPGAAGGLQSRSLLR
jgi:hypothetical protein